ncbi:hypothetical protein [Zhengella mangrovi]|nr:hypothetical protein [Zhengella mangrovi]
MELISIAEHPEAMAALSMEAKPHAMLADTFLKVLPIFAAAARLPKGS